MVRIAVRRESVRLELEDHFSTGMVKAAAATALLDKNLDHLSGSSVKAGNSTKGTSRDVDGLTRSSRDADRSINQLTGRLSLLADTAAVLGPSLVPIGGVGIAAVSGLASAFGFAAVGAGTAVVAFQGVGDALKAVNKAQLEPTTANLNAARTALEGLSPAAADFVGQIHTMMPQLKALRDASAEGLFPGVTAGLDALEGAFPRVQNIFSAISTELGNIAEETGYSLASERWAPFLDFLATEGPSALGDLAEAVGNTAHAFAGLWMSTTPLNNDFSDWLVNATADLDVWANKLGSTNGFTEFVSYVEETGPQVAETFGAIANAAVQILQAIAPLGGPVLQIIESLANAIASIADSPIGTPLFGMVAALALINRSMAITASLSKATFGGPAVAAIRANESALAGVGITAGRAEKALGLLSKAFIGLAAFQLADDAFGLSRTDAQIQQMTGLLDAQAGTSVTDRIKATQAEIARQQQTADNANIHVNLGVVDIYSSDKAAKAADNVIGLKKHLAELNNEAEVNQAAADQAAAANVKLGHALKSGSLSADQFREALVRAQNTLAGRGAEADYEASIDAMTDSLKKNGKTLDITTEKGRANRAALDSIATGALAVADKISDPKLKGKFLDSARGEFIRAAKAAGLGAKAARSLATDVGLLNSVKGTAKVEVDGITKSKDDLASLQARINGISGKTVTVSVGVTGQRTIGGVRLYAGGGHVVGPGGPKDDLIPAYLSNDEYVMPADAVAHYGLSTMEAMRAKKLAGGGSASGKRDTLTTAELNSANSSLTGSLSSSLGLTASGPAADIRSAFHDFAVQIRQDGGKVGKGFYDLQNDLIRSSKAIDKNRDAIEKERGRRDRLNARLDSLTDRSNGLSDTIAGGLRKDIFTTDRSSPWLSNAEQKKMLGSNPLDVLRGNIRDARAFTAAEKTLKAKGLGGDAFAALASTGDLAQVQSFAGKSKKELAEYERLYALEKKATRGAGNFGADVKFGAAIASVKALEAASTAEIKGLRGDLNREIKDLRGDVKGLAAEIGKTINKAAAPPKRGH